jgi:ribonuclease BN (tRNA processing enzyme)
MKLLFLGTGSAFTLEEGNFQSNLFLIDDRDRKLLIDCGSDIRFSLKAARFSHLDVTDIYISHLHGDHVGGLEYIGFSTKFDPRCDRPNLYLSHELAPELWNCVLSGGMRSIQGDVADLETYFRVSVIHSPREFTWHQTRFQLVPAVHIIDRESEMLSYGLFFNFDGVKVFYTSDSQFCPDRLWTWFEQADVIFHDCETTSSKSTVHAHYDELVTLPKQIRNKMWLYHYQPGTKPDARRDGFLGFVRPGQCFEASELLPCDCSSRSNSIF